jgi:hypothetical protein
MAASSIRNLFLGTFVVALLAACGGGAQAPEGPTPESRAAVGTFARRPPPIVTPPTVTTVDLQSDAGDYIGQGQSYHYTKANANLSITVAQGVISVSVAGDQNWSGHFQYSRLASTLRLGQYPHLARYPAAATGRGASMDWSGQGRGCNALSGSFDISSATYVDGALQSFSLSFTQHCEGAMPAMHGVVNWAANDPTVGPGPVAPPPGLWSPDPSVLPASGRYVYLQSDAGDYIGGGGTYLYTSSNAQLSKSTSDGLLHVGVAGNQNWTGDFKAMSGLTQLVPGYYGDLSRYPFFNPLKGGLDWSGEGRGCNQLSGWFVVDSVSYVDGALASISLRFEQHCEGAAAALHGAVNWTAVDTGGPSGPVSPPPGLWAPDAGLLPASGRYVYLQSDAGDYIGGGVNRLYTGANASLSDSASGAQFHINVNGDTWWYGDFSAMSGLTALAPGYYGGIGRFPFNNLTTGGLSWYGDGRGCNTLTGWFVVDEVSYVNGALASIKLRFEQHCEGGAAALHGAISWTATDTATPPGPVSPPPAGLWSPDPAALPASGRYVYLKSDAGDYIGGGQTYLYTDANMGMSASSNGGLFAIYLNKNFDWWSGDFLAMNTIAKLQPGYYGSLERYPFNNPVKGGLNWDGEGRGCNTLTGWFVVDDVTYVNDALTSIKLRFEQHCEGGTAALHGQIYWTQ